MTELQWERTNPLLYLKIKEYDTERNESPFQVKQFQEHIKKLHQQIQRKADTGRYVFPRKKQETYIKFQREDNVLAQQLEGMTYNLHTQNIHKLRSRDPRHSSNLAVSRNSHKISFVVRRNDRSHFNKDQQKRGRSLAAGSGDNQAVIKYSARRDIKNRTSCLQNKAKLVIPVQPNSLKSNDHHRKLYSSIQRTKNTQQLVNRKLSTNSTNQSNISAKSKLLQLQSNNMGTKATKLKFGCLKRYKLIKTQMEISPEN